MRILFFLQTLGVGGVERQVSLLADHLIRRGHHVGIAALHTLDENWRWFWDPGSMPVELFLSEKPGNALSAGSQFVEAALKLRSLLKRENIQLVYSAQGPVSNCLAWLGTRGQPEIKLVWSVRSSGAGPISYHNGWKDVLLSNMCRHVSGSIPLTISISEAGLFDRRARGWKCLKGVVIHNGIDVSEFRSDPEERVRVRAEWGIRENERLIGLVGRLAPVKGHPTFLRAAALLSREQTDVRFVCVGDGPQPYPNQLKKLSTELDLTGRLLWAGNRKDMRAVYNALDIVCSPSYSEGFNNVIAEAMACGVPCVVTDTGDPVNIVGDIGVTVPPGNTAALVHGVNSMLDTLRQINPQLLRDRIAERFGVETMVDATERELLAVCRGSESVPDRGGIT